MTFEEYKTKEEKRINIALGHMEKGVEFVDINTAYIDESVEIGEGTLIGPCVTLEGKTVIGKNCRIYQNTRIKDSVINDGVEITSSVVLESSIGEKTKVGPFAYLRPNSRIGKECKVGDFVEVKNSTFGDGTKASHLTYIGDSDVGNNVNMGCGVVFVNYDGTNKYRCTVGDGAFIGCNSNLISPVTVESGAYVAAGSTVTDNVPEDALCIARARQTNINGWAAKKGLYRKK
ncbi:MAG: UDP-N-acetylglucosamine diphosphorylase [Eubacteriaceae bacterium]|nr:UDP-N-acetylglucosamine diphosphorylase [Eubacteriaceae bacterium]